MRIPKNKLVIIKSGHPDSYWILTLKVLHPLVSSFPEIVSDLQQKVPYFGEPPQSQGNQHSWLPPHEKSLGQNHPAN